MWLKDKNGSLYRIESITSVTPAEIRGDRRDQTKITEVRATITTAGGHTHTTELAFGDVAKLVDPSQSADAPAPAPGQ